MEKKQRQRQGRPVFIPRPKDEDKTTPDPFLAHQEVPKERESLSDQREMNSMEPMVDTTVDDMRDSPSLPTPSEPQPSDGGRSLEGVGTLEGASRRYPTRTWKAPDRFGGTKLGNLSATEAARIYGRRGMKRLCFALACSLVGASDLMQQVRCSMARYLNADFGTQEAFHPWWGIQPAAMKMKRVSDPDLPTFWDAQRREDWPDFVTAMQKEVDMLEELDTWHWVKRSDVAKTAGGNPITPLPTTWAMRVKRFPDGTLRKHKARLCVRGDKQVKGVHYDKKFAPVVQWSTVRMLLCLAAHQNLATRQIDFSNAFVQASLDKDVYIEPFMGIEEMNMKRNPRPEGDYVLKLKKSLYGQVDAPLYYYRYLREKLIGYGFEASSYDPCLYIRKSDGMMMCTYVDDCIFFHKDQAAIDTLIAQMKEDMPLTMEDGEDNAYAFLGVTVKRHENGDVELTQTGLIKKVLALCGMEDCNAKDTPAGTVPLGTDSKGEPCQHDWDYASAVGMLMYLCSNSRPDIQFAVHQCARFTHQPKHSHELAILRICRYLKGTSDRDCALHQRKNSSSTCTSMLILLDSTTLRTSRILFQ